MEKIELEDFVLEVFDKECIEHRRIGVLLDNDNDFYNYMGYMQYIVDNRNMKREKGQSDELYAIYHRGEYLGIIGLVELEMLPYLIIAIIPEKKNQKYGCRVLKEYVEYLFKHYPNYEDIYASINPKNEFSVKTFLKVGFTNETRTKYVKKRN